MSKYKSQLTGPQIDAGILLKVSRDFTSQEIRSWNPGLIVLLAAIQNSFIIPVQYIFEYTYGGQAFANGSNFGIHFLQNNGTIISPIPFDLLAGSALTSPESWSQIGYAKSMFALSSDISKGKRVAFGYQNGVAFTNGNGTAKITLWYMLG